MPTPLVKSCFCGCCNLRSGGLVIGYISLGSGGFSFIVYLIVLVNSWVVQTYTVLVFVEACITLILFLLWLIGVYNDKPIVMIPAIIWTILDVVFGIVKVGLAIAGYEDPFFAYEKNNLSHETSLTLTIIAAVIYVVFFVYIIIVMYSLYVSMSDINQRRLQHAQRGPWQ